MKTNQIFITVNYSDKSINNKMVSVCGFYQPLHIDGQAANKQSASLYAIFFAYKICAYLPVQIQK